MNIDADSRLVECGRHDEIGRLPAHTRQLAQLLDGGRNTTVEFVSQHNRQFLEMACLGAIETNRKDQFFEAGKRHCLQIGWAPDHLEQAVAGGRSCLVLGTGTQNSRDQYPEGIFRACPDEVNHRRVATVILAFKNPVYGRNVRLLHAHRMPDMPVLSSRSCDSRKNRVSSAQDWPGGPVLLEAKLFGQIDSLVARLGRQSCDRLINLDHDLGHTLIVQRFSRVSIRVVGSVSIGS